MLNSAATRTNANLYSMRYNKCIIFMLYQRELKYCNTLRSLWVMYGTQGTWWKGTWKKSKIQNTVTSVYILYTNIKNQIHPKHSAQGKLRSISLFSLAYEKYEIRGLSRQICCFEPIFEAFSEPKVCRNILWAG